jgi:ADP-heptose:LPS heptosyltransferase
MCDVQSVRIRNAVRIALACSLHPTTLADQTPQAPDRPSRNAPFCVPGSIARAGRYRITMSKPVHHTKTIERWRNEPPRKIVLFRALMLGDMLVAVPAMRAVRAAFPDAEIHLCALPWARSFVERFSDYLDELREFPGCPGLPERSSDLAAMAAFLASMQAERYDLAIQLHGCGPTVNPLMLLWGAQTDAGFYLPGDFCPNPDTFIPWPDQGLELDRMLAVTEHLGIPSQGRHLEFPLTETDHAALRSLPEAAELEPGGYACIHPGASVPQRRWPISHFIEVAQSLCDRGLHVVITGSANEAPLAKTIVQATNPLRRGNRVSAAKVVDLTGKTDLGSLGALLSDACLLVCNDTGVSHVADGLQVPSVVISTGDNWKRWSPPDRRLHRVLHSPDGVAVEQVLVQVEALLTRTGSRSLERIGS